MNNKTLKNYSAGVFAVFLPWVSYSASALTVTDTFIGGDDHGHGDVIGSAANFDTLSMDVSLSGSMLTVSINTNFAGKGDNGLFSGVTYGNGIGYGDLFLSSSWTPYGTAPYLNDNASTGTVWTYGFSLDNRWMQENTGTGTGTLYSLNSGNNNADILLSEDFLSGATYRNGQEVAVDTVNGNVTALSSGTWTIDTANNRLNFLLDLSGTSLLQGSEIALHWGPTCGNDVIEGIGVSAVPVPAAVWLFGSGLLGLVAVARRK